MKLVEIVTHCWAVQLPHYANLLCYQLSGFLLDRPKTCRVHVTVCCEPDDEKTLDVLSWFRHRTPLSLTTMLLPNKHALGRRAIGRNSAARGTKADLVWFADCDQVWDGGCLDRLVAMNWPEGAEMLFPREVMICRDHKIGDRLAQSVGRPRLVELDRSLFVPKTYHRAIGGAQIVRGDFARMHGYLPDDEHHQQPADKPFGTFRDDIAYRKQVLRIGGKIVAVDLPGMYRIRHSETTYR